MKWFTPLKNFWTKCPKGKRIKLIVMLLLIGTILLLFPSSPSKKASNSPPTNMINQQNLPTREFEELLSKITGHEVRVLIAYADTGEVEVVSEETVTAETKSATGALQQKKDQKPVLDANKNIQIKNKHQPRIKGVCVFCFAPYSRETEELLYRAARGSLGADLHTVEVIFDSYPAH
ncbi:MAG: hypothetical protein IKW04_01645 [Clostridia bacterium]|nr:hypothetical protein [Clostridia bacterium]